MNFGMKSGNRKMSHPRADRADGPKTRQVSRPGGGKHKPCKES